MRCIVVQTAFLGDSVLTLPLLSALACSERVSWLGVVSSPAGAEFLSGQAVADLVVGYDKRGRDRGTAGLARVVREVTRVGPDVALIPHRSFRSALIPALAHIPRRLGFDVSGGRFLLTDRVPYVRESHEVDRVYALGEFLGLKREPGKRVVFNVSVPDGEERATDELLAEHGVGAGADVIAIAPGSRWTTKRWAPAGFASVGDGLFASTGAVIVIVGSADDRGACAEVADAMDATAVNLAGGLSIGGLEAVLSRSRLLVSNDSASAHIAAGLGTPVVAVFGPTVRAQGYAPYADAARVAEIPLDCRPCGRHGGDRCRLGTMACMNGVSTAQVMSLAGDLLGEEVSGA